tara:strand:+ start:1826 stop:2713 length:888 start_codon:yes stop_codon:yes gene_type:complete
MSTNRKSIVSLCATASYDEVFETLDQDGCVILEKLTSSNTTDSIQRELALDIQNTLPGNGDFVGYKTKRTHTVLANSKTAGLLALESLIMSVCEFFLGPFCSKFQLSSSVVISLGPEEYRQEFHRDDLVYPLKHPTKQQSVVTVIWALDDFTAENGATLVIPGSHRWDDLKEPNPGDAVVAIMPKGSALILLGSTYHAGGTNTSKVTRTALLYGYCLGWLRQEQNQYLAIPPEIAKDLSEDLQRLIGYTIHEPFLGWHDLQDPSVVLQGYRDGSKGAQDLIARDRQEVVQTEIAD